MKLAGCLLLVALAPARLSAIELEITYPALERILATQLFTQDGRRYVRGSKTSKCNFAYLENPRINADANRLHVVAHFSGRSARSIFGNCMGFGDDFDLSITAMPYYRDGAIAFRDVRVASLGRDGLYIRAVRAALTQSLSRDFEYHLLDDARRLLEEKRAGAVYAQQLRDFHVAQIRVMPEALVLTIEFRLTVK